MTVTIPDFWVGFIAGGLSMLLCLIVIAVLVPRRSSRGS